MVLNENVDRKIIPVAGGKGGVGKSLIAVNLALSMAMNGKRVVIVDLDLGGSNIHTLLGEKNNKPGIGNFISGLKKKLGSLAAPTAWDNLSYIPGDGLVCGIGELTRPVKTRVIRGIQDIDADYIIIDLGGGTSFSVLDFFLISNSGLIVTTPQATSVMNAYLFLKNYVFQFLRRIFADNSKVSLYLKKTFKERLPKDRTPIPSIVKEIETLDPSIRGKAEAFIEVLQPKLVLNMISDPSEIAAAEGLRDLCRQNLMLSIECLGTVMSSPTAADSANRCKPLLDLYPNEIITSEIHRLSQKILQSTNFPEMPLELEYYPDSYALAQIEAENDVSLIQQEAEIPTDTDNYEVEKLLELIQAQQSRIQELQGTVRMLSMNQDPT